MSQTHAVEKSSNLRVLPLPGRHDVAASGATPPQTQPTKDAAQASGALTVAGRSQQAENFLYVSYGPVSLAQAANLQLYTPRTAFASGRQPLADHVVNLLLQDHETQTDTGHAPNPGGGTTAAERYRSAADGFPLGSDSLFSLIG